MVLTPPGGNGSLSSPLTSGPKLPGQPEGSAAERGPYRSASGTQGQAAEEDSGPAGAGGQCPRGTLTSPDGPVTRRSLGDLLVPSSCSQRQGLQPQLVLNFGETLLAGGQGCPVARSLWTAQSAWVHPLGSSMPSPGQRLNHQRTARPPSRSSGPLSAWRPHTSSYRRGRWVGRPGVQAAP